MRFLKSNLNPTVYRRITRLQFNRLSFFSDSTMEIGFHLSIKPGIDNIPIIAIELGYTHFQFFTRSSRSWKFKELSVDVVEKFKFNRKVKGFKTTTIHLPYLPNLSSIEKEVQAKSRASLMEEVKRADLLGVEYLVIHIGSHKGAGTGVAIESVVNALNRVIRVSKRVKILLETSSGYKNSVASTFEELNSIIENVERANRIGVCFDSCHVFAAGYDLRDEESVKRVIRQFDDILGIEYLNLIHLNDSKGKLGSGLDRHQHIGKGEIGKEGFRSLLNHPQLESIPIILETPNSPEYGDKDNLRYVKSLLSSK